MELLDDVDPRLRASLEEALRDRLRAPVDGLPRGVTIVLAGHRAAGKSRLLPKVGALLGRPTVELDAELERVSGRTLMEWVTADLESFRHAERAAFAGLPKGGVVAVGGGFLAAHPDVLGAAITVLVPVSFETYVDRLQTDPSRPRLRPSLALLEELREVFFEREQKHAAFRPMPFVEFLLRMKKPQRARRVVTLPPATDAYSFAWRAKRAGADLLEVRTDLTDTDTDLRPTARALPLLIAERTRPVPPDWARLATLIDKPLGVAGASLVSVHADGPAARAWPASIDGTHLKHVEPLTSFNQVTDLLTFQEQLIHQFPNHAVTVLATGPLATSTRALLATDNALEYCAMDASWSAAPGQRLLADVARESRKTGAPSPARLAILGKGVMHSKSPLIHDQPFDRLDLPDDVNLDEVLSALWLIYRGFAVTSPFKKRAAVAVGGALPAVNTLVRTETGWNGFNTDVEGARVCLEAFGEASVTVLGAGGVLWALREAARMLNISLDVRVHAEDFLRPVRGATVWTWPAEVEAPTGLSIKQGKVAVIAYGPAARIVSARVIACGGVPVRLGPRWFIAQAREQRRLWRETSR